MPDDALVEKKKKLKYVKVYDQLYANIQNGVYPPGSQLPPEPELAAQMGVSRMTLRQAMAILQEDNLIKNMHGKGNFVKAREADSPVCGMEVTCNPIHNCCLETFDEIELEFRLEPPTDFIVKVLERRCAAVVIIDRWFKNHGKAIAYTLTLLPIEVISKESINLNQPQELKEYLEETIYNAAAESTLHISHSTTGNFTAQKYTLSSNTSFVLIQESLYDESGIVLAVNKHYLPSDLFQLDIHSSNTHKKGR